MAIVAKCYFLSNRQQLLPVVVVTDVVVVVVADVVVVVVAEVVVVVVAVVTVVVVVVDGFILIKVTIKATKAPITTPPTTAPNKPITIRRRFCLRSLQSIIIIIIIILSISHTDHHHFLHLRDCFRNSYECMKVCCHFRWSDRSICLTHQMTFG